MMQILLFVAALHQLVTGSPSSNGCTAPECISFAHSIKNNMNASVDPCDDFYEFACGQWSENNPIPSDQDQWNIFQIMNNVTSEKLIEMLNDDSNPSTTTEAYQKAKKMYQNCMDLEAIERNGVEAIISRLSHTGGWPVMMALEDWTTNVVTLSQIHGYYTRGLGLAPIYAIYALSDVKNSSVNKLYIDAPFSTPFKDILLSHERNSPQVVQYAEKITRVVNILADATGNVVNVADVQEDVDDLIDFERSLAKLIPDPLATADIERRRNLMTVSDVQTWYNNLSKSENSEITWIDMLRSVLENTGIYFTDDSEVIFTEKEFAANVAELLDNSKMRTIVNYIQWVFINKMLIAAPEELRNISSELLQLQTGVKASENRNVTCTQLLQLQHAVSHEFVKHQFSSDTKIKAKEIITEISNAFGQVLRQTSWLKPDEQQFLQDKLRTMIHSIGYPEWYNDPVNVDNYYRECYINDTFLDNLIEVRRFENKINLRQLAKLVDKKAFLMNPSEFNAQYAPTVNTITFTSAVLQSPIFSSDYPSVLRYALFGTIAGHEISHAFDDNGAGFDKDGNYVNWWSDETKDIFESKVDCFVEQYDNFIIYEDETITINARGVLSKTEDIADLHGLKLAYTAYANTKTPEDENLRLPSLESYDDQQLFFLAHATLWCSAANEEFYMNKARNDWHSIPRFRAIGALSNMKEFSTAFNCPHTAKMNPPTKCVIWGADTTIQQEESQFESEDETNDTR